MSGVSDDRDERHVEALAETIRQGIESGSGDEDIEQLARAVLGDEENEPDAPAERDRS
jgi:hypothetical protein